MWCRVYVLVLLLLVTIARPTESSSLCANRKPSSGPATASGSPPDPPPGSMQMCSNLLAFGARGRVHDGFGFSPADGETECQLQTTGTFEPRPSQEISGLKKTKEEQAIAIANLSAALEEALRGKQIAEENARREKAEKEREKQEKEREKEEKEREKQEKEREKKEKEQALLRVKEAQARLFFFERLSNNVYFNSKQAYGSMCRAFKWAVDSIRTLCLGW